MLFDRHTARLQAWFERQAASKHARYWLWLISFTESSFFPIPPDPFLVAVLLKQRERWFRVSFEVALFSVLGGLFGYLIGFGLYEFIGKPIVDWYHLEAEFVYVTSLFNEHVFLTVLTAAFTPIPYKIFTIAAGVAQANILLFVLASVIGRGVRFIFEGYIMKLFGERLGSVFFKNFNRVTLIAGILIVLYTVYEVIW